jgi:flagellar hook assembly protein FlgD
MNNVNEEKSMGEHSSIWDGKDDFGRLVSAGVYVYIIMANPISKEDKKPFRASGKMLMTK